MAAVNSDSKHFYSKVGASGMTEWIDLKSGLKIRANSSTLKYEFSPDDGATWKPLGGGIAQWEAFTDYESTPPSIVVHDEKIFQAKSTFTSGMVFDQSNWTEISRASSNGNLMKYPSFDDPAFMTEWTCTNCTIAYITSEDTLKPIHGTGMMKISCSGAGTAVIDVATSGNSALTTRAMFHYHTEDDGVTVAGRSDGSTLTAPHVLTLSKSSGNAWENPTPWIFPQGTTSTGVEIGCATDDVIYVDGNWDGGIYTHTDQVSTGVQAELIVEASGSSSNVLAANDPIPFLTESVDAYSAWSGTVFTAPDTAIYSVSATALFTTSTNGSLRLYIDGAASTYLTPRVTDLLYSGSITLKLNSGQTLSINLGDRSGTVSTSSAHVIRISKISNPRSITGNCTGGPLKCADEYSVNVLNNGSITRGTSNPAVVWEDSISRSAAGNVTVNFSSLGLQDNPGIELACDNTTSDGECFYTTLTNTSVTIRSFDNSVGNDINFSLKITRHGRDAIGNRVIEASLKCLNFVASETFCGYDEFTGRALYKRCAVDTGVKSTNFPIATFALGLTPVSLTGVYRENSGGDWIPLNFTSNSSNTNYIAATYQPSNGEIVVQVVGWSTNGVRVCMEYTKP